MTELLTAAQMRAIEQAAIDSGDVTGLELMERAGRGVVEAILEWRPALAAAPHRAVVLCGPGNNGGDGFVVARLLKQRGWEVEVFLYGDQAKLPPDAAVNCRRWRDLGGVASIEKARILPDRNWSCQLVVDALFGTGLTRPLEGLHELTSTLVEAHDNFFNKLGYPAIVSVDMPSGTCSDSGRFLHQAQPLHPFQCIFADLTVTFHRPRIGHYLTADFTDYGDLMVMDIGLPDNSPRDVARLTNPRTERLQLFLRDHKYTHGHALILAGPKGKTGAARLAARGALRIGAGLVTVASPASALAETAAQLTAIMLEEVEGADALGVLLEDDRLNALCLGPGLGRGERTRALVRTALAANRSTVLDADALTSFAGNPPAFFEHLHRNCVLTPHGGEFKRLFPDIAEKLEAPATRGPAYSKVDATREAAARAGCTVLFKGPDTVIADEAGRTAINAAHYDRAAPWLATAGSGDVLAGFITGLLARGLNPLAAADTAAWLHVDCALKFGPGLIAEDIPEQLPRVFRDLGL